MNEIRAIPFGQADCFLTTLEDREKKYHILVDGGSKLWSGKGLPEILKELKIEEIDLLILTHLHQDHIGWLEEISHSIKIYKAVLPFPAKTIMLPEKIVGKEVTEDYRSLLNLEQNLSAQNTDVVYTNLLMQYFSYAFGEYRFTLIYPDTQTKLPFYTIFRNGRNVSENEWEKTVSLINGDSSVWLLTKGKRQIALFCGDCFEENFAQSYQNYANEHGLIEGIEVLKLSHHGRNDKGHVYFTEDFVNQLKPIQIWITNSMENAIKYQEQWKGFSMRCRKQVIGETGAFIKFV